MLLFYKKRIIKFIAIIKNPNPFPNTSTNPNLTLTLALTALYLLYHS